MLTKKTSSNFFVAMALVSLAFFADSVIGQQQAASVDGLRKEVASAQRSKLQELGVTADDTKKGTAEGKRADDGKPTDVKAEIDAVKAENAAVREMLQKMQEQQKVLLETVDRLQKRLDGVAVTADPNSVAPGTQASAATDPARTIPTSPPDASPVATGPPNYGKPISAKQIDDNDRYQDGIIIWKTADDAKVPFMMRFNNNTQFRYLNTMDSDDTFTDHLGVVREVHNRNDLTVNRAMFFLNGYIWDKRLGYSLVVWTSAGSASIIVAGDISWRFNKHITIRGGYTGVPGSRSLVNTFPYYTATDRSMADNFFRPGFTQGVWATGEITKGLKYQAFVGNSNNTLSISAAKIDTNLMFAASTWWEPFGNYAPPGKSVNMYDDYSGEKKLRIRLGTSFTRSREDRFSNLDVSIPDNTAIYNSDGVNAFSTGAFALGVTLDKALYKMWAIDWGVKYNGLAINGQYYTRWLSEFEADGPMPLTSTLDQGYELSVGKFIVPRKLMGYVRASQVFGEFKDPYEYGAGLKWHFLPTERLWLNVELMKVKGAPYSGAFSPYTAGMNGWVPMVQTIIAF